MGIAKLSFLLLLPLCSISQVPTTANIFEKIRNYYINHPEPVAIIKFEQKISIAYDTLEYFVPYAKDLNNKTGTYAYLNLDDDNSTIKSMLMFDKYYYWINVKDCTKQKYEKKDLKYSPISTFDLFPSHNLDKLETNFGRPVSLVKEKASWLLTTNKYLLTIDTASFRINKAFAIERYEGKNGFVLNQYVEPTNPLLLGFKKKMEEIALASENFALVSMKELDKKRISPSVFKKKQFLFQSLTALNEHNLDSLKKGKYIILDFFYHACMPCHVMTDYILEWLPTIDASKIILVGVDPFDSDAATRIFIKEKHISYPIITNKLAKAIAKEYKIGAYPTLMLIAPDGTIEEIHEGSSQQFLKDAERLVKKQ